MAGFLAGLEGLGAGLGQFAQQQQGQQDQQLQRLLLGLKLRELVTTQQRAKAASDAAAGFALGGGGGAPPVPGAAAPGGSPDLSALSSLNGFGGGFGGAPPMPRPPAPHMPPVNGMARGGASLPPPPARNPAAGLAAAEVSPLPVNMSAIGGTQSPAILAGGDRTAGPAPASVPSGAVPPAPDPYDPNAVAVAIKRAHPEMDSQTLMEAVALVGEHAGPRAKQAYERWKNQADITLRQNQQHETGRHNVVEEGFTGQRIAGETAGRDETKRYHGVEADLAQQRIAGEMTGRTETGRHNLVEEGLAGRRETEMERAHRAAEVGRDKAFQGRIDKQQQATTLATTQMKTLADRARRLYAAVEADPSLVGGKGIIKRTLGSIGEQTGVYHDPKLAAADDFRSQLQMLQAQLQKPLLGARYFSGKAQERLDKLVPGMERLDNPTLVKSALRNIAEALEETAGATEAASRGVQGDFSHLSDQDILQQLGGQPGQ